MAIGIFGQI